MKKTIIISLRIIIFGLVLPLKIWQFSKEKLLSNVECDSITSLLDKDYIATSWLDLMIDSIILLIYPVGVLIVVLVSILTDASFFAFLGLIPLYFSILVISFAKELGGSFMLLHLNVKKIRKILENK